MPSDQSSKSSSLFTSSRDRFFLTNSSVKKRSYVFAVGCLRGSSNIAIQITNISQASLDPDYEFF